MEARTGNVKKGKVEMDARLKIVLVEQENFSRKFGEHRHVPNPAAVSKSEKRCT